MGGQGSTRWVNYQKKRLVEDTLAISVRSLQQYIMDVRRTGQANVGRLHLLVDGRPTEAAVRVTLAARSDGVAMGLQYGIRGTQAREYDYWISLEGRASNLVPDAVGRWYFVCPECESHTTTLYLPPDATFFACHSCHNLTYRSRQTEHRYDAVARITARELGLDEEQTRRAIRVLLSG